MPASAFDLPTPNEAQAKTARAWLLLGVAALFGAGLYSLLLVLARTPFVQHQFPLIDFFRTALVVHVNLSVLIWLLSMAGMIWGLACRYASPAWDRLSFRLAATGTLTIALSPLLGATDPLMNNYVPVLRHPVFFIGLGLFAAGISSHLIRCGVDWIKPALSQIEPSSLLHSGSRVAAFITTAALLTLAVTFSYLPRPLWELAEFELLFWSSGHIVQFAHALLMMVAWVLLANASECTPSASDRTYRVCLFLLALPVLAVPPIFMAWEVQTVEHRLAFTELMRYGGLTCLPIGALILASLWRAGRPAQGEAAYLRSALWSSMTLFASGGVLGFMIAGLDIVIPAHYHGSTVGVTIAFMGACYYLFPRLGMGRVPARLAFWQPIIYASGQLMHIIGLAWIGGYGARRKTVDIGRFSLEQLGELLGFGFMGLGGLLSVVGGLLFLLVAWRVIRGAAHREPAADLQPQTATASEPGDP